jgi:hypothetical protein
MQERSTSNLALDGSHRRRGHLLSEQATWRRMELGTNHIACFGVWRRGARRQAERLNRTGQTRWHMPHKSGTAIALPGAACENASEN